MVRSFERTPLGAVLILLALAPATLRAAVDDVSLSHQQLSKTSSSLDASVSTDNSSLDTSMIASLRTRSSTVVRLESMWKYDLENSSSTVRLGDTTSNPGAWGSAVRFAGVQFGTPFEMRSDLMYSSRLAMSGLSVVPTTGDALFATSRSTDTAIGQRGLSLVKAPMIGANGLSVTARDAVGRTTTFTQALAPGIRRAEAGCKSYSMSVGRVRENYAQVTTSYGPWFANSTITCGGDSGLSFEAHGEFLQGESGVAGLDVARTLGKKAAASVAVVTSNNQLGTGWSMRAGLQHSDDLFELSLRARLQSAEFRDLGTDATADAIAQRMLASIAAKLGDRRTLALAYAMQKTYALQRTDIVAMTQTFSLGQKGMMSIAANRDVNDDRNSSINLSFTKPLPF